MKFASVRVVTRDKGSRVPYRRVFHRQRRCCDVCLSALASERDAPAITGYRAESETSERVVDKEHSPDDHS